MADEFECPVPSAMDDYDRLRRRRGDGMYLSLREMPLTLHECNDYCVCPVHGIPLLYSPARDDHACQDIACEHGHGGLDPVLAAFDAAFDPISAGHLKRFAVEQGFEDASALTQLMRKGETPR